MSFNQSRSDENETQYRRTGRSGSFDQPRGPTGAYGRGSGGPAPSPSSSSNRSYKKSNNNAQGGQPRAAPSVPAVNTSSESNASIPRGVQNGAHVPRHFHGASDEPVSVPAAEQAEPSAAPRSFRGVPNASRWQRAVNFQQKGLLPSPQTPLVTMHKTENRYTVAKVTDKEDAKQRRLEAILNKLTPLNFKKLSKQAKAVNIGEARTLRGVVAQIFDKALMEPTFCEMYADFCFHLSEYLPDFNEDNVKINFKRLLINMCQEVFERGEREQEESNKADKQTEEEREEKRIKARRRMLGNIRLIGELFKKKMLTERIMHECIKKLLGQDQTHDEEDIEALCILMNTIGQSIDHPKAKEPMDFYFEVMRNLSNDMKLSSRVRFMLKDSIDLRKNNWQQRRKVTDEEDAKQRRMKAILNKLTPQNFEKLFEQVKAVNIDEARTLRGVISQIFDKALMEPTFCEMYAKICFHLSGDLPDFIEDNVKITIKRLLLNKCQEEFERGEREQEESNKADEDGEVKQTEEEREEKRIKARRRMLGNIRLIGELFKKKMLNERIMHECIKKLLGQDQTPHEEGIEALCKLMNTIGQSIDRPKAKEQMDAYFEAMRNLSNNMKLSSRVRFMLKDSIDLRKNNWQQRRKVTDEEDAKQRRMKAILNKLTPQNFERLFEQVKAVNIDEARTLRGVFAQIFDKALTEPTFCEMYAKICFHLSGDLPDFIEDNVKITFKRLLINKCQEEFERGEREQEESNKADEDGEVKQTEEEREEKRIKARRRMLGNIRLIGELFKKKMLNEWIMHECIKKLLGQDQTPDEEGIEALCKLMNTIGQSIDRPKAKEQMDAYFEAMRNLSNNMKLSSRVRFMLKDSIDLRKNNWQQRRKVTDEEDAKQRRLKAMLNKLTPQNFEKLFEQVKAVNIDEARTLRGVIAQIFDKALMEPTFCEMYADFCFHLSGDLPDFNEDNVKITFKRLLLNKCQEEFERGEREQEEANKADEEGEVKQTEEEREEKRIKARRRMLGNIRLIGELFKKKMLTERIMHECIKKLLGQDQTPDEEDIEALCILMNTIGQSIDHPKAKEHMDYYFEAMRNLSNNMKLSSRVRFMLKDSIDLRKNNWLQRKKVEGTTFS